MDPKAYVEMASTEDVHWWFVARRHIIRSLLRSTLERGPREILEVGAGTGGNLKMLSEFGRVAAMEMNESARALAREKVTEEVRIEYGRCPDDLPFKDDRFDLICMFDVLEHIDQDVQCLRSLASKLKPQGRIVITVPAYQWMWGPHDEHLHHIRRYTATTLTQSLHESGYHVDRISYFNTLLFPLAVAARLKDRVLTGKNATGVSTPAPIMNNLMRAVFSLESRMLSKVNLPFGVSLLAIATVNDSAT